MNKLNEVITKEETGIDRELFKDYFKFQMPTAMLKTLYNLNDTGKNNLLMDMIKNRLSDLKNEIKKMSEDETKIEKPYGLKFMINQKKITVLISSLAL